MNQKSVLWPEGRIFPAFPPSEKTVDAVRSEDGFPPLLLALSVLSGIVNRGGARLLVVDSKAGEGAETWPAELGVSLNYISPDEALRRYAGEARGIVVYSTRRCRQFANLAATVAGLRDAIPLPAEMLRRMKASGRDIGLPVLEDLSDLRLYNSLDVYGYMYENVWPECSHRILLTLSPMRPFHMRDLGSACRLATVWLDCRNSPAEKELYEKFLKNMTPGASICMGWYTEERSGITTATKYGLSTVPADFFVAPTLFFRDAPVRIRPEPEIPEPENKFYAALFVSDGDNIQYCQHHMRQYWDRSEASRGKVAVNWTISPSLCETGPDLMNYYYGHSTDKDCFVSGPSGLGYAMPNNTLDQDIPCGPYVGDDAAFARYCAMSARYFEKCGMRAVTVWDELTPAQREIYAANAPGLLGLTVQHFTENRETATSVSGGLICKQLTPCYVSTPEQLESVFRRELDAWDGKAPRFIAAQFTVWGKISIGDLEKLEKTLSAETGGKVEFVRADVFFGMYRKALGLDG